MSGVAAESTATATPEPQAGGETTTEGTGGKVITRDVMLRHLEKRGHKVADDSARAEPSTTSAKEAASDEEQAEKATEKDEKADEKQDPAAAKQIEALEARVAHFEGREAQWAEVVDKIVAQRDHFKALAQQVERALPELGYEIDPQMRENLELKQRLAEFNARDERAKADAAARQQMQAHAQREAQVQSIVARAEALIEQYPELNPDNDEAADFWSTFASKKSGNLERDAVAFVKYQRSVANADRDSATGRFQAPRTMAGARTPRAQAAPSSLSWDSIRAIANSRYGER